MKKSNLAMLAGVAFLGLAFAAPAYAAGTGMPWEGPLQQVLDSITGPVARAAGVIAIVITGVGLMFSSGGSGMHKLAMVGLGLSVIFAAATWGLTLFGFAGGATL
jgi:type IV secretion system protein TrbC